MEFKEDIKVKYSTELSKFQNTEIEAVFIIKHFLSESDIKIHSIQSRVKELNSLMKKAETLELDSLDMVFEEIKDIVGIRIICLFISDIREIARLIRTNFIVIYENNKLDGSDISSFGYFSVHFVVKLNDNLKGPRYDNIKDIAFEIQVRTISMDAWANISHYLDYKSDVEIPKELKRDFFALSGLFYVADTHFEMFFKNKKEQSRIAQKDVQQKADTDLNFETVEAYINGKFKKQKPANSESISKLTQELSEFGYKTINEIDEKIEQGFKKFPKQESSTSLNRVGVVRDTLRRIDLSYSKYLNKIWQERRRIDKK